jgi:outer membrane protein assembly factor BamB
MERRHFLALAAVAPALAVPTRKIQKVEIAFKSAVPHPNGLQATPEGLWMIDQDAGNRAALVSYSDGAVIRQFETETDRSSGITCDGDTLWIGSTYSRETVRVSAKDGKTIERHFTPGAGVIYRMAGDPPARSSPLAKSRPQTAAAPPKEPASTTPGTGAHGQEWRNGKLWFTVPPSREVYRIDPKTWTVEAKFPVAGNRPHGIGWEGRYLWVTDSNWNAFFKHDPDTGAIVEKIQLADSDPLPHGMTIWQGHLWYCDDVGVVCRFKL